MAFFVFKTISNQWNLSVSVDPVEMEIPDYPTIIKVESFFFSSHFNQIRL